MKPVLFICSLIVASCSACTTIMPRSAKNILTEDEYAIPSQADHFVACKVAVKYSCGIKLMQCSNGMKYECAQSVLVVNIEDIQNAVSQEQ